MSTESLYFTKQHEWIRVEGTTATEGITDYAQAALGDITFVEFPATGRVLKQGDETVEIESCKAAACAYAAVSGTVLSVNNALEADPAAINSDPYGAGWLFTLEIADPKELDGLMNEAQYQAFIAET